MKLHTITIEIGTDDDISEEIIRERISNAIAENFTEVKLFRINDVKKQKVASGEYRLNIDEAKRLGLNTK